MMSELPPLGIGFYTSVEAARLLKVPPVNINRWLGGYSYRRNDKIHEIPPLWDAQLSRSEHHIELGFRDLIELRFVNAFIKAGLGLKTIRHCLVHAKDCIGDERPFSTQRFRTDGKTIFLESARANGDVDLLDLKRSQYTIAKAIERSFKDLDIDHDAVARWRPFSGKSTVVIDPERAFGQPIVAEYGIPTISLAQAAEAEGSIRRASRLYEVPASIVKDAIAFEKSLAMT